MLFSEISAIPWGEAPRRERVDPRHLLSREELEVDQALVERDQREDVEPAEPRRRYSIDLLSAKGNTLNITFYNPEQGHAWGWYRESEVAIVLRPSRSEQQNRQMRIRVLGYRNPPMRTVSSCTCFPS